MTLPEPEILQIHGLSPEHLVDQGVAFTVCLTLFLRINMIVSAQTKSGFHFLLSNVTSYDCGMTCQKFSVIAVQPPLKVVA